MRAFTEALQPGEADFWNRKLIETFSEAAENAPGDTVSKAYARAFEAFQKDKWQVLAEGPAALTPAEYAKMDAGPDLTAISRLRFGATPKKVKKEKGPKRGLTAYQRFMKKTLAELKDEDQKTRFKICSQRWKAMSKEEQDQYKTDE